MKRTEEVKVRVTIEEKSSWQQQADAEADGNLSDLIRERMEAPETQPPPEGSAPRVRLCVPSSIECSSRESREACSNPDCQNGECHPPLVRFPIILKPRLDWSTFTGDLPTMDAGAPVESILDLDDIGIIQEENVRRTEPCACGKPSWIFCKTCDV